MAAVARALGAAGIAVVCVAARPARAECVPMDEAAFTEAVRAARASIEAEDLDGFEAACAAIEARVPCLTFVPTPRAWAEYLVGVAAVSHYRGGDWQTPLATAVRAAPDVDRAVSPDHEMATWLPDPLPLPVATVPEGVALFVDGAPTEHVPAPAGLHLVQLRDGTGLRSILLRNEPVPGDWYEVSAGEVSDGTGLTVEGTISLVGGLALDTQTVDVPGTYADLADRQVPDVGLAAAGWVGRGFGVGVDGVFGLASPVDLVAAASYRGAHLGGGFGAVLATARPTEGGERRSVLLAAPAATGWARWGSGRTVDAAVDVGLAPALAHVGLGAGLAIPVGPVRVRLGLGARFARASFVQPGFERTLGVTSVRVLAGAGVGWGER